MKNIARLLQVATLAVLVVGVSKPAAAQVTAETFRFGYQFANIGCSGCDSTSVPLGFYGDVSGKIGPPAVKMLDWVGQATFGHKSDSISNVDFSRNLFTVGGGVRYVFPTMDMKFKAHAQGLLLIAHSSTGDATVNGVTVLSGGSSNDLGIEISAAVDYPLDNGWTVTGGAGIQIISESTSTHVFVLRVGVVRKIK